jgi:hypothetical protein
MQRTTFTRISVRQHTGTAKHLSYQHHFLSKTYLDHGQHGVSLAYKKLHFESADTHSGDQQCPT